MKIVYYLTDHTITMMDTEASIPPAVLTKAKNPEAFRKAIKHLGKDKLTKAFAIVSSPDTWMTGLGVSDGDNADTVMYAGIPVPRMMITQFNNRSTGPRIKKFLANLSQNPALHAIHELADFVAACDTITIDDDGFLLAYKGVTDEYLDVYSQTVDNSPGQHHVMPRNQVDDDRNEPCSAGFHVGSFDYAKSWGKRVMLVRINPRDVVSIPKDVHFQKLRCTEYFVIKEMIGENQQPREIEEADIEERRFDYEPDEAAQNYRDRRPAPWPSCMAYP